MNNKGFTLIEIIAVIMIIGIIALIAIPSYTAYVNSTRRSAYFTDVKSYVESAKSGLYSREYGPLPEENEAIIIPAKNIKLAEEIAYKSPFAMFEDQYTYIVVVARVTTGAAPSIVYDYYATFLDRSGYGINNVPSTRLEKKSIQRITDLTTIVSIGDIMNGRSLTYGGIEYTSCPGGDVNNPYHPLCAI